MVRTARFAFEDDEEFRQPLFTDLDNDLDDPCLERPSSRSDGPFHSLGGSKNSQSPADDTSDDLFDERHRQRPKAA